MHNPSGDRDFDVLAIRNPPGEEDNSVYWAELTYNTYGYIPDVVFTSEPYGYTWAEELTKLHNQTEVAFWGAAPKEVEHVLVDKERIAIPVSGTKVRDNPLSMWNYLSDPVREYFAHKICIVGGESTGKSTMVQSLVEHFGGAHTTEAGRTFVEIHGNDQDNLAIWPYIMREQPALENKAARHSDNGLVFCDTDLHTTSIWASVWIMKETGLRKRIRDAAITHAPQYKEYILLSHEDVPWVDDGTRSEGMKRDFFTQNIELALKTHKLPYTMFRGSFEERTESVIAHLEKTIPSV